MRLERTDTHTDATDAELAELEALRPRTRADCANVPRPCPFVSCRYHVLTDHLRKGGASSRGMHPERCSISCALDFVDARPDGGTQEEVGRALGYTQARVQQVEALAISKLNALLDADVAPQAPGPTPEQVRRFASKHFRRSLNKRCRERTYAMVAAIEMCPHGLKAIADCFGLTANTVCIAGRRKYSDAERKKIDTLKAFVAKKLLDEIEKP